MDTTHQSKGTMRRVQFIELHEQAWFPSSIRNQLTEALRFGLNLLNAYAPTSPQLRGALDATGSESIIDLCSGGGGPWVSLLRKLQPEHSSGNQRALQVLLTDKYPNLAAVENVKPVSGNDIVFYPDSVDAMKVPHQLKGLRTMFTSFHHFSPEDARAVLQNAVDAGEGIGVFEITRRASSTVCLMPAWVVVLIVCTPLIRPFRWTRLVWTYLIPIIPLVLLFDGVVSCLRTYRPEELREIVGKLTATGYRWEIGEHSPAKAPITYLIGYPGA